jgi:hypothetical protein
VTRTIDAPTTSRWPARLTADLDAADERARVLATNLSTEQLNWRPSAGGWSVGQCLEHLSVSNETYVDPITDALKGCPVHPVDDITPSWFSRWFLRTYMEPRVDQPRARAPRKIQPTSARLDASILDRFIASNAKIREVISAARDCDVNRVRFKNPFVSIVRFTVGVGILNLTRHNHRHLLQAERVTQEPGFPRV